jgi:transposase
LPEDQLLLGLEEVQQSEAADGAKAEESTPRLRAERGEKRRLNRSSLPRVETIVDIEDKNCPCCGNGLHRIGEDVSERLDVIPAQFRVLVVRRPKAGWF